MSTSVCCNQVYSTNQQLVTSGITAFQQPSKLFGSYCLGVNKGHMFGVLMGMFNCSNLFVLTEMAVKYARLGEKPVTSPCLRSLKVALWPQYLSSALSSEPSRVPGRERTHWSNSFAWPCVFRSWCTLPSLCLDLFLSQTTQCLHCIKRV